MVPPVEDLVGFASCGCVILIIENLLSGEEKEKEKEKEIRV
jgi:hypothetical protein